MEAPVSVPEELDLEARSVVQVATAVKEPNVIFSLRSSLLPLIRIVALCLRFAVNCRKPAQRNTSAFVTVHETSAAKMVLTRLVQRECFSDEISSLKKRYQVSNKSSLKLLSPFLDEDGTISRWSSASLYGEIFHATSSSIVEIAHLHSFAHRILSSSNTARRMSTNAFCYATGVLANSWSTSR